MRAFGAKQLHDAGYNITLYSKQFALPGNQQTCRAGLVSRDRLERAPRFGQYLVE
jgi:hypothetical protein